MTACAATSATPDGDHRQEPQQRAPVRDQQDHDDDAERCRTAGCCRCPRTRALESAARAGRAGDVHGEPVGALVAVSRSWSADVAGLGPAVVAEVERHDDLGGLAVLGRDRAGDLAVELGERGRTRRRRRCSLVWSSRGEAGGPLVDDDGRDRVGRRERSSARRAPGSTRRRRAATTWRRSSRRRSACRPAGRRRPRRPARRSQRRT